MHTELFTDAVLDLVEAGAVTGARKEINRGIAHPDFRDNLEREARRLYHV